MVFLLAGFETTSSTLSYATWVLISKPEEMKKLQEEMDATFNVNIKFQFLRNVLHIFI